MGADAGGGRGLVFRRGSFGGSCPNALRAILAGSPRGSGQVLLRRGSVGLHPFVDNVCAGALPQAGIADAFSPLHRQFGRPIGGVCYDL